MNVLFESLDAYYAGDSRRRASVHDVGTLVWGGYIDLRFAPSTNELYALHRETGQVELLVKIKSAELGHALLMLPGWMAKDMTWVRGRILTAPTDPAEIAEAIVRWRHAWEAHSAVNDD